MSAFLRSDAATLIIFGARAGQYDDTALYHRATRPGPLTHGSPSAYPPDRSLAILPSNFYFAWTKASADEFIAEAMRLSAVGRGRDSGRTGLDECRALHQLRIVWNTAGGDVW
jgi:hypothetical protein